MNAVQYIVKNGIWRDLTFLGQIITDMACAINMVRDSKIKNIRLQKVWNETQVTVWDNLKEPKN